MAVRFRRYFLAGLLIWLPIGATVVIFSLLLDLFDGLMMILPSGMRPDVMFGFHVPGFGVFVAFIVLVGTGVLGANLLGRRLVKSYESVLNRIPLVGAVYGAVKHFSEIVFSDSTKSFKKVILVEYPREGLYSLAFQTSEDPPEVEAVIGESIVAVFLPTTPNPTSGFMLLMPRGSITELDMSVEDALKMIISLGVVVPQWHPAHPGSEVAPSKATP
jgi:uncharacterized membrane protein